MCASRGRNSCRIWHVAQNRSSIPGAFRVVRQSGDVRASGRHGFERAQDHAVQSSAPDGGNGVQDCLAGQVVAEDEHVGMLHQHADGEAFLQGVELSWQDRLQEPGLSPRSANRGSLHQRDAGCRQSRHSAEYGVADAEWQARAGAGQDLCHKERVAARLLAQRRGVDRALPDQRRDGALAQRRQVDARRGRGGSDLPQERAQRLSGTDLVVPTREHQQS